MTRQNHASYSFCPGITLLCSHFIGGNMSRGHPYFHVGRESTLLLGAVKVRMLNYLCKVIVTFINLMFAKVLCLY